MVFGPNLGPTWANLASKTLPKFGIQGALGTQAPPRPPQDPPRPPQDLAKTPQKPPQDPPKCFNNVPSACQNLLKMRYKYKKKKHRPFQNIQNMKYEIRTKGKGEYLPLLVFPKERRWPQTLTFEPPLVAKIPKITKVRQDQPAPPKIW